jgi:hypothetical protein
MVKAGYRDRLTEPTGVRVHRVDARPGAAALEAEVTEARPGRVLGSIGIMGIPDGSSPVSMCLRTARAGAWWMAFRAR